MRTLTRDRVSVNLKGEKKKKSLGGWGAEKVGAPSATRKGMHICRQSRPRWRMSAVSVSVCSGMHGFVLSIMCVCVRPLD